MEKETWKDIPQFIGVYQISNYGRVKSIKSNKEHIKSLSINKGYIYVSLYKNNIHKYISVHRLVAYSFIPTIKNKNQVNHKDGNKKNNYYENLEWVTCSENNKHSFDILGRKTWCTGLFGINNKTSKQILQFSKDGEFIKEWGSQREITRELNIDYRNISSCCLNKPTFKTAGGFIWKFKIKEL